MGERKGTNLYYPPDYDPRKGGINKFQGTHALRERARKLHMGILIIRFEMPFNIWCDGCGNHIGMGVRYNAEKKKIGMYYTTPIYQFRMKCHLCDNHFEIKTDPGNLEYVIVSGARRQENRWDPTKNEQVVPEDKETSKKLFDDAMFKLEHQNKDENVGKKQTERINRLLQRNDDVWKDNFSANLALRKIFRGDKKRQKAEEFKRNLLKKKSSLNIDILPEHPDDIKMASLMCLTPSKSVDEKLDEKRMEIMTKAALPSSSGRQTSFAGLRAEKVLKKTALDHERIGVVAKKSKLVPDYNSSSSENEGV
ncbi:UNVERIFIED_CONTAM: hypothetical protein PYX00_004880 [Menopon gallinae]|uniref:Coiled-coil domain-containing protein 130 n=1 Tax=Menopon gallinae TaxID=328185 RepID=A0AAW2I7P8_9NEOP